MKEWEKVNLTTFVKSNNNQVNHKEKIIAQPFI